SEFPLADLYVCWSPKAIYLGLYAQDVTEDVFYKDKIVRTSDRAEWIVSVNGSALRIRSRLGAGLEPVVDPSNVRLVNVSGLNGEFRSIAALSCRRSYSVGTGSRRAMRSNWTRPSSPTATLIAWTGREDSPCEARGASRRESLRRREMFVHDHPGAVVF